MKITETRMDKFHKKLTDEDILAYAKNIGELKKKINEAEYAKKNLKNLYREMSEITGILEKGEVSRYMAATFTYHYPEENLVTITPEHITDFPAVVRPMTEIEIERHCEHVLEFEEPEEEDSSTVDDATAIMLDQIDNEEYYDLGTFVPEEEEAEEEAEIAQEQPKKSTLLKDIEESMQIREWISKLQIYRNMENREEHYAKINEKYHEAIVNPKNSDDVWKYYIVAGYEKYETKRREDEIVLGFLNKRRNYIRVNNGQQKQEVTTTPEPELNEPQPLSTIHVYKSPTNQYYILDEQLNPIRLKVLNSLENVVFLEREGVEGVILKRHSEITPGGEIA